MPDVREAHAPHGAYAEGADVGAARRGRLQERSLTSLAAVYQCLGSVGGYDQEGWIRIEGGDGQYAYGGRHGSNVVWDGAGRAGGRAGGSRQ